MLTIKELRRKPKHFHNFTGLTPERFDRLLLALEPLYEQAEQERLKNPNRLRARGAGRNFDLELSERLLMSLMYFRLYVTQTLLGYLFGLDPSNVSREINGRMLGVLSEVLPVPARDEPLSDLALEASSSSGGGSDGGGKRKRGGKKIGTLEELLEKHPQFEEVFIDATEQELPKPKDKDRRKGFYSGKRKRHTAKMQLVSTKKLVLHLCRHVPGKVSDLVLLRATGVMHRIPEGTVVRVDKGYEGLVRRISGGRDRETQESQARSSADGAGEALQQSDEYFEDAGRARDRAPEEVPDAGGDLPGQVGALR